MPPARLRAAIRGITLPDGFKVATLLDARTEQANKFRNGLERLHEDHLKAKRDTLMTEGAGKPIPLEACRRFLKSLTTPAW